MNFGADTVAVQSALKLTALLTVAWLAHWALSTRNPRWTVCLWRVTLAGACALSIAAALPPLYGVPLLNPVGVRSDSSVAGSVARERTTGVAPGHASRTALGDIEVPASNTTGPKQPPNHAARISQSLPTPVLQPENGDLAERSQTDADGAPSAATGADSAWRIDWWSLGIMVYVIVSLCLLARPATGLFLSRREALRAQPAPDWVQAIALRISAHHGVAPIPVRVTNRFDSPMLLGVLRPVILLPEGMLRSASAESDVPGAIAHEAAHAATKDLFWDCLLAVFSALLWPHPLVWRAREAHRTACERVSDREAADYLGDVSAYQRLLARIALRVSGAASTVGVAMARQSEVRGRLVALVRFPTAPRLGHRAVLFAVGVLVAVALLGVGSLVGKSARGAAPPDIADSGARANEEAELAAVPRRSRPQSLRFMVLRNDDGKPIANAKVRVRMYNDKPNVNRELTTDAQGVATFEYPDGERPVYLSAKVLRPGMVPYYVNFGRDLIPEALPTEKTVRMDRGKKVGGTVVDADGKPVAVARVSISVPATDSPSEIYYRLLDVETGSDGSWLFDGAPLALNGIQARIEHPRFIKDSRLVQDRVDGRYVLDPGLTLSGHVLDRNGKPVPSAHISFGRDRWGALREPVPVDPDGSYHVYAQKPQSTWVTAEAPEFAPQVKPVELYDETKPIDFELAPGHTTRFAVVNDAGEPIPGIRIVADTWNGFRSLWWKARTDEDGFATWNGAPSDPVEFHLLGEGYSAARDVLVAAREEPHLVRLHRPLRIHGSVADLRGRRLPEFHVELGRTFPGRDEISWMSHRGSTGRNGVFEIRYAETCDEVYLRIEAAGFRPWQSGAISFAKGEHEVFVRLEAGAGSAGTVWGPDGRPVAGARLTILTASEGMQFTGGYRPRGGNQTIASDRTGHFEFVPLEEPSLIVGVHESGYAETTAEEIAKIGGIRLQEWAKIEAVVRRGDKPLAGAKVAVHPDPGWQRKQVVRIFSYGIEGTTDENGRVVFDRVVPRNAGVHKTVEQVRGSARMVYSERSVMVDLSPGKTARVVLGGSGSAVTGRFSIAGEPPLEHHWSANEVVEISGVDERRSADPSNYFRCLIDKEGSFRAEDLPSGRYRLRVALTAAPDPDGTGPVIGRIDREIEVSGDSAVVDLGAIEGTWFDRLGAGDRAPAFVAEGIGGEVVRLGALRGRLVLIDFWATSSVPCMAEMPKLAKLHREFADDPRFRLLSLSVDRSIDDAAAALERNDWPWLFAFAGPGKTGTVSASYEVRTIPERFLVDVDGTILYRGGDIETIAELVRKRLAELPAEISTEDDGASDQAPLGVDQ